MIYALLCSGGLGFDVLSNLNNELQIKFVFTDKKSADIISFCKNNNILLYVGNPRNGLADKFILENELEIHKVDVIISVNYLFIIEKNIINLAKKIAFNVHGSLLPKYRGRTPHVWSIINNESYTGITAHIIDEGCDTGDIIEQEKIKIETTDTGGSLLEKYNIRYLPLIRKVINNIKTNKVSFIKQDDSKATYFGKRTPEDGQIDWDWQKERINNWVRAQALPYPGAFTFLGKNKVYIDEIKFSDFGFDYNLKNGTILNLDPMIVKVQNGCVEITKYRGEIDNIKLKDIFCNENK